MTREEIESWDSLYKYVKFKVLKYTGEMNIPKYMVLKLKELKTGRHFARTDVFSEYEYTYDDILLTFICCTFEIERALKHKQFDNEKKKFNYLMAIVKNNINDVVLRKRKILEEKQRLEKIELEHLESETATYKTKDKKTQENLKELW